MLTSVAMKHTAIEVEKLQKIIDGRVEAGILPEIYQRLCLVNAENTIAIGEPDTSLTSATDFIGHASYMFQHAPTADWLLQVQAAINSMAT